MSDKDVDYHIDEDMEKLFHSDLQNMELGHDKNNHDDVVGDHLPEWLVGVIVVIIMLIIAFFVMIITSIVKNRQKNRSATYISTTPLCDDLEAGKMGNGGGNGMKMTSFSTVSEGLNGKVQENTSTSDMSQLIGDKNRLTSGQAGLENTEGVQSFRNPLFVDDDADLEKKNKKSEVSNGDIMKGQGGDVGNDATTTIGDTDAQCKSKGKGSFGKHKHSPKKSNAAPAVPAVPDSSGGAKGQDSSPQQLVKSTTQSPSRKNQNESTASPAEALKHAKDGGEVKTGSTGTKVGSDGSSKLDLESCCEDSGIELCSGESPPGCGSNSRSQSLTTEEEELDSNPSVSPKSSFHLTEAIVHGDHAEHLSDEAALPGPYLGDDEENCVMDIMLAAGLTVVDTAEKMNKEKVKVEVHRENIDNQLPDDVLALPTPSETFTTQLINMDEEVSSFAMSTNL